jgi:hypothetical protein
MTPTALSRHLVVRNGIRVTYSLCLSTELQFQLAVRGVSTHIAAHERRDSFADQIASPRVVGLLKGSGQELEALENSVKRLQAELHEIRSRNLYLMTLVEEQKV